jgi:hypothetical protein
MLPTQAFWQMTCTRLLTPLVIFEVASLSDCKHKTSRAWNQNIWAVKSGAVRN